MNKFLINIDWLQFGGVFSDELICGAIGEYKLLKDNLTTNVFADSFVVMSHNLDKVCTILCNPKTPVLNPRTFKVVFSNWVLYNENKEQIISDIFTLFVHAEKLQITRIDFCVDFNELEDYTPQELCRDIANKKLKRKGRGAGCLYFEHDNFGIEYTGVRFGVRSAGVCTYMYNKSLELKQKKYKPYIVACWRDAGLDPAHVWRLEFSVSGDGFKYADKESGLFVDLSDINIPIDKRFVIDLLASRYFDIRRNESANISRCPKVNLFAGLCDYKTTKIKDSGFSLNVIKGYLRKMYEHALTHKYLEDYETLILNIEEIGQKYCLNDWLHKMMKEYVY